MNKLEFAESLNKTFKNIPNNFFDQIDKYKIFLQKYNQKMNLTRLDSESKIYGDYFYESIIPYKDFDFSKINLLLDIGSGSGIPGVVLKLLYPHIELTIIEANNKKCVFLKELCNHLGIKTVILNQRAEKIEKHQREQFDCVTSRAVASLSIMIEISLPYLKVDGLLIEPKSKKMYDEMPSAEKIISNLGGKFLQVNQFSSINNK
jgi:16S rRNA (guanine527-N7)-methyltransferase